MSAVEIRGSAQGLVDEPFAFDLKGSGGAAALWRARVRDDDDRVWRAQAATPLDLAATWSAKQSPTHGAFASLHPLRIDVRAELEDGRTAARTFTRLLVAAGVRVRRWREKGLAATLYLPTALTGPTLLLAAGEAAAVAAPLLASRGALVLIVRAGEDTAAERLAQVPGATPHHRLEQLPWPANLPGQQPREWAALLELFSLAAAPPPPAP